MVVAAVVVRLTGRVRWLGSGQLVLAVSWFAAVVVVAVLVGTVGLPVGVVVGTGGLDRRSSSPWGSTLLVLI